MNWSPRRAKVAHGFSWVSFVVALGAAPALGCKAVKEDFDKQFKVSFVTEFGPSCTKGAVRQGAPEDKVKPMCECMGHYLVDHHSTGELTKLSVAVNTPDGQKLFQEAAIACKSASMNAARL